MTNPLEDGISSENSNSNPPPTDSPSAESAGEEIDLNQFDLNTPPTPAPPTPETTPAANPLPLDPGPLVMVETAFLASAASLIWLINYYFPLGPVLRIFFPVPIALVYLRWGKRAAWMSALVSGLLLSVLMGPTRSILFIMPFGILGVLLGWMWRRGAGWGISIFSGTLIGSFGVFFRIWLLSILLGQDLWVYLTSQITQFTEWIFERLGFLEQPNLIVIQLIGLTLILLNNALYLFAVHLAASLLLERLGNPIPPPPQWVQALIDEE